MVMRVDDHTKLPLIHLSSWLQITPQDLEDFLCDHFQTRERIKVPL